MSSCKASTPSPRALSPMRPEQWMCSLCQCYQWTALSRLSSENSYTDAYSSISLETQTNVQRLPLHHWWMPFSRSSSKKNSNDLKLCLPGDLNNQSSEASPVSVMVQEHLPCWTPLIQSSAPWQSWAMNIQWLPCDTDSKLCLLRDMGNEHAGKNLLIHMHV